MNRFFFCLYSVSSLAQLSVLSMTGANSHVVKQSRQNYQTIINHYFRNDLMDIVRLLNTSSALTLILIVLQCSQKSGQKKGGV